MKLPCLKLHETAIEDVLNLEGIFKLGFAHMFNGMGSCILTGILICPDLLL